MAKKITIEGIPDYLEGQIEQLVREAGVFLEGRLITLSPVGEINGGTFKSGWQKRIEGLSFVSFNNTQDYGQAITFGVNMPPSWKGQFRSRFGLPKAWPEVLAAKETKEQIPKIWNRIVRSS
tara:strand:+ start:257 stop:622 length:366 start_codon:yes stop_codon:yes gene_type:complete